MYGFINKPCLYSVFFFKGLFPLPLIAFSLISYFELSLGGFDLPWGFLYEQFWILWFNCLCLLWWYILCLNLLLLNLLRLELNLLLLCFLWFLHEKLWILWILWAKNLCSHIVCHRSFLGFLDKEFGVLWLLCAWNLIFLPDHFSCF